MRRYGVQGMAQEPLKRYTVAGAAGESGRVHVAPKPAICLHPGTGFDASVQVAVR